MMNEVQMNEMTTATEVQLKESTVEFINELVENNYYDGDMYEFINEYGEDNFVNHYENYVECGESNSYDAVDAFVEEFGFDCLSSFEDSFHGQWDSAEEFTESFVTDCFSLEIPEFVVIDWKNTWECNLRHDFIYNNGYVFDRNF